jgi:hypothetical protein
MNKITNEWLKGKNACFDGVKWFDENYPKGSLPIPVLKKLSKEDRFDWANWTIVRVMTRPQYLKYGVYAAEQVIDIFEKKYPNDKRPRQAIEAAKRVIDNDTEENRRAAAYAAADAAYAAAYAAADAAYAGYTAYTAYAAHAAADAADAADAAADAAYAALAAYAAYAAADKKAMQIKILNYGIKLLKGGE